MLILFSACFYSAGAIIFKKYLSHLDHELVLFTRASIALGFFFLVSPFLEHNLMAEVRAFPLVLLPALIGFSFVARFLYLMSFYEAMERLTVRTVSLVMPLMVVVSVIFAHFYLSEIIHWYHVVGGALIVLGMVLLQLSNLHPTEKNLEGEMKMHHKHHV
jgi:drug/metabolite transporter (DMT)-like permease